MALFSSIFAQLAAPPLHFLRGTGDNDKQMQLTELHSIKIKGKK